MDLLLGGGKPPEQPESWMKRNIKPLIVVASLLAALFLTVGRRGTQGGVGIVAQKRSSAEPEHERYDLSALNVFRRILLRITDAYVEPERIKPKQMLVAALHQVERTVAEVLVQESSDKHKVNVRVQDVERTFDISGVDSPWALSSMVKQILRFIQPHLNAGTDVRDIEYATINGMLSTLDPHSVLLRPDVYNEMKLSTRGEFGGLGIVISMIQGVLTVMNPMKGTPAAGAGLKSCDQILKIGPESTVNMTLTQAVQRLRGAPGSKVSITIMRQVWKRPVRKTLKRDVIKVDSVSSRMLAKKIGYVRLGSFQGNSYQDLRQHLARLDKKGMRGLVLDLRGNPGGLLDQAIKVSDLFLDSGTILTTVSHAGKKREEKRATREGTEDRYPIVALVNSGSASASEIVSGALKNLDRGIIIGRRTFGKGSVQVLYDNDDGSALKLTIAQYLTPGDISIQSVGITPDVVTAPVIVRKDLIRLRRQDNSPREGDLRRHLTHRNARRSDAATTVRYLAELPHQEQSKDVDTNNLCLYPDRRCKPTDEDRFVEDFQIRLAQNLLAQARGWRRSQILGSSDRFFAKVEAEEQQRIERALAKLGVDWTPKKVAAPALASATAVVPTAPAAGAKTGPALAVSVTTDPPSGKVSACRPMTMTVSVRNTGHEPVHQLAAVSESSNRIFANHEWVFGRLAPGQTRRWTVPIKLRDAPTRVDEVTWKFFGPEGQRYATHSTRLSVKGVERPVFAYGYQLIDDIEGNLDGRVQRGERVRLFVKVRNTGRGPAFRTVTSLKNLSGVGIFIRKGRFILGRLAPGERKTASFTLDVQPSYERSSFKVELSVSDDGLQENVSEKLSFKVARHADAPVAMHGELKVTAKWASLRAWGGDDAPVVGSAPRGARFPLLGRAGGWYRVESGSKRPAFIASSDGSAKIGVPARPPTKGSFFARWQVTPPKISLRVPTYATDKASLQIKGTATDETRVSDVYIFVGNPDAKVEGQKVFYRSNRGSATPKALNFSAKVPLWAGANYITFFARENNEVQSQQTVVVLRRTTENQVAKRAGKESQANN